MVFCVCPCFCATDSIDITKPIPESPATVITQPSEKISLRKTPREENGKKISVAPINRPVSEIIQNEGEAALKGRREGVVVGIDSKDISTDSNVEKFEKEESTKTLILNALMKNDFLKNIVLDEVRMNAIIDAMYPLEFSKDNFIIREGDSGSHLYVSEYGKFNVVKKGKIVKSFEGGEAFGELAILYKAKRFASVVAYTDARVWSLKRKIFQTIMVKTGKQELEENVNFLSTVPILEGTPQTYLYKIANCLRREFFPTGVKIVKQGEKGDKFYIIRGGMVDITQHTAEGGQEEFIKELKRGDFFGEQALLHEDDKRLATVTAKAPGVECLTIARKPFIEYFGNIDGIKPLDIPEKYGKPRMTIESNEYSHIELDQLRILTTIGIGAFGRVELVEYVKDKNTTFALKCLKKVDVVSLQQQDNAFNEKYVMFQCKSPFICKLYKTYKDSKFVYFLMEPLLGGDLWTTLQEKRYFDNKTVRFMAACVIEAFDHLHGYGIVYRDLKPENLMLNPNGYIKLVDFGYAKYLTAHKKTYTFAGTPEYVAPEVILGNGHDKAVDYWALGILIYEMFVGKPPFRGTNHVKTYNLIIRGIDTVNFDAKVPKLVQTLIKKLCRTIPSERLGCLREGIADIRNHRWFADFEWEKLRNLTMPAPLPRPIKNCRDTCRFDKYQKGKLPPDENSRWDADF